MKKLLLILAMFFLSIGMMGQKMSNYEKYKLEQEQSINADTLYKNDTVFVGEVKREYDDLYYIPSKDDIKRKKQDIRLTQKKIRIEQNALYYDAKQEVYNDLSNYYFNYRFFSFRPSYYYGYSYYYEPWILNSWYWGYGYSYPYYNSSWYFGYNYHYPYYHNYYNHYGHNNINIYNYSYGRNNRPSNFSSSVNKPVTVNRTVSIDRRNGKVVSTQVQNQNRTAINRSTQPATPERRTATSNQSKAAYSDQRRTYAPSYNTPRMNTRPQYNNSRVGDNRNVSQPMEQRRIAPQSTQPSMNNVRSSAPQNRSSYSAPTRSYVETQSRREYSAPTQSRSYDSSPSRSYSESSRSSGSYSGGGESRSSGSSSSSSGNSSAGSSGTSSGRR